MNKLFNLTQAKGKWHKFPSFNLGGGAKLYKNFAQKLLAVSLCMAVVLLGTPVTTFAEEVVGEVTLSADGKTVTGVTAPADKEKNDITKVDIPASVTTIGASAFGGCSSLTSIDIPASVTTIGGRAFKGCSSLKSIELPASVTTIGGGAFEGCSSLESVFIPTSVSAIPESAFQSCTSLASVTIPGSVATIGSGAFHTCSSLESVFIPASISSIDLAAFAGCSALTSLTVDPANAKYKSENNLLFSKDGTALICCPGGLTSVTIPASVTYIGGYAFVGCSSLTSLTVPCDFDLELFGWNAAGDEFTGASGLLPASGYTDDFRLTDETTYKVFSFDEGGFVAAGTFTLSHEWDDGKITTPATCTEAGVMTYTCTREGCGETKTETVDAPPADTPAASAYLEAAVAVRGQQQRLRVYDPNGVLPEGTTLSAEAVTAHEHIDDDHEIEHLLAYDLSLLDASGNPLHMPLDAPVELCFEVLDGLDKDELEVVLVQEFDDAEFEENLVDIDGASWIKVKTNHFSPYALIDKLSPEEKGVQVQDDPSPAVSSSDSNSGAGNNAKTGDLATQITVAGLGMTLVLVLGIMLRLITNKRKFEE